MSKAALILAGYNKADNIEYNIAETTELLKSAGYDEIHNMYQIIDTITAKTYIGKGKVEQAMQYIEDNDISIVVFDNTLSGSQIRNLEEVLQVKVIDRNLLILDLFAARAQSKEGRLQVELAQLKYTLPRLSALDQSNGRYGAAVGSRGPGETKVELDRRRIQQKIVDIEKQVKDISRVRASQNKNRKQVNNVAIVGYTNAGKTTLLNAITKADAYADDRLFATLDTLSKKVWHNGVSYVITDTVGFVSRLPHDLTYAFSATLEESVDADILLILYDISDPQCIQKLNSVKDVLKSLNIDEKKYLYVANKADAMTSSQIEDMMQFLPKSVLISAYKMSGIDKLKDDINNRLNDNN